MSVLLTDEAVEQIRYWIDKRCTGGTDEDLEAARLGAFDFVHYHANEGREALVEHVARVIAWARVGPFRWVNLTDPAQREFREQAEAVVTALFGDGS